MSEYGTLREMGALLRAMPGPNSTDIETALWYERKSLLFQQIAAESHDNKATARELARQAHEHAIALTEPKEAA